MYYMNCCTNQKLLEKKVIFIEKAKDIILGYTDITNIINFNQQIETLKVVLLSKKERSKFENIYKHSFNNKIRREIFEVFLFDEPLITYTEYKEKVRKFRNSLI